MNSKNKLIVFEGIDGVGKTTIALELKKALKKKGIPVIFFEDYELKHPGFCPLKPLIKKIPITGSHLFYLASAVYKSQIIKKLLEKHWVICDRYFYSTNAYHKARGSNLKIQGMNDLLKPDYAFLLTIDEKIRQERVKQKLHITKADLIPKRVGFFPHKMESFLKKMDLVNIDNSVSVKNTIKNILSLIFKK
jgi:dTMP kinase